MKSAFLGLALVTGTIASPLGLLDGVLASKFCPAKANVQKFMDRFISILEHVDSDLGDYVATANAILTDDFHEISDSINMLANKPLGSVTADKSAYIVGAQHAPPTTGIQSLGVTLSNCDTIIWEWTMSGVGQATYPVKGFGLFKLAKAADRKVRLQASELKLEFNNIAWGLDTGYGWVKQDGTLIGKPPTGCAPTSTTTPTTTGDSTGDSSTTSSNGSTTSSEAASTE